MESVNDVAVKKGKKPRNSYRKASTGNMIFYCCLLAIGYERTVEVSSPGEFSVRGGVSGDDTNGHVGTFCGAGSPTNTILNPLDRMTSASPG